MPSNLYKKKTPPMVGAPIPKKKKKKVVTKPKNTAKPKTKVKPKNPKNKSIMNTPTKQIPKAIKKKVKQKIKNVMNNTPKQNLKKLIYGDTNPYVKMYNRTKRFARKLKK